ncbi:UPF0758 protein [Clostridia bacterium]|nr:UPF0758 protein [Clostridia bacterium]
MCISVRNTDEASTNHKKGDRMDKSDSSDNPTTGKPRVNHSGHRERKKRQFLCNGIDALADHEIIEILLYYGIPNGNVNHLAHELADRYGTLCGLLNAKYDDLIEIKGVGAHTASLIVFSRLIAQKYIVQHYKESGDNIKTQNFNNSINAVADELKRYCLSLFLGKDAEQAYAFVLDGEGRIISEKMLSSGSGAFVNLSPQSVITFSENAAAVGCVEIVLAHNHPADRGFPSRSDVVSTQRAAKLLISEGYVLRDSIVTGVDGAFSMREEGLLV